MRKGKLRRKIRRLPYPFASQLARNAEHEGTAPELMLPLYEHVLETAPEGETESWRLRVEAARAGRRIRHSSFPVRFLQPVDAELEQAVEEALRGNEEGTKQ
jgi:hypothetical protein